MKWTLTPDQFALAWERTDGDRIPYPLAVRMSARTVAERAAQLPGLDEWCASTLDPDLEAALRVLARPAVLVEVIGEFDDRPVRVLGAADGHVTVVAAQRAGEQRDRGADVRLFVGNPKTLAARIVSVLPENTAGAGARQTAPLDRVREDSRDLVTMPVSGPSVPARMRRLLRQPRDGIGQIVVSARRADDSVRPLAVLCWIDIAGDGRYTVRTRAEVEIVPATAETFAAQLRPLLSAADRLVSGDVGW